MGFITDTEEYELLTGDCVWCKGTGVDKHDTDSRCSCCDGRRKAIDPYKVVLVK